MACVAHGVSWVAFAKINDMLEWNASQIREMDKKRRIRLHNSLLGGKPVHLVGTRSAAGVPNLAVFNSACHVSSDPPLIGMMCRPTTVRRDTYENLRETGVWTLNAISAAMLERAHRAADKLPAEVSEFEHAGLGEGQWPDFAAPFVEESPLQMGFSLVEEVPIRSSGTLFLVGELQWLRMAESGLSGDGSVQADQLGLLSSLGLDAYAEVRECARFTYRSAGNA